MSHDSDQSPKGRDPQGLDAKHANAVPEGQSPEHGREHSRDREIAALRDALQRIAELDYPRPVGKVYRTDGVNSKHDQCPHGVWMYEECGNCLSAFAASVLEDTRHG